MTVSNDPGHYGWWIASRTAGIVALLAMSLTVTLGLYLAVRGQPRRAGAAAAIRSVHEHLAIVTLLAIGLHAVTLLGDPWLRPGVVGLVVPFQIDYRPAWVACGIAATALVAIFGLSAYMRRAIGPSRQKLIHRFTLLGYLLAVGHALGAGSDASTPWLRAIIALPLIPAAYYAALRLTNPVRPLPQPRPVRRAAK